MGRQRIAERHSGSSSKNSRTGHRMRARSPPAPTSRETPSAAAGTETEAGRRPATRDAASPPGALRRSPRTIRPIRNLATSLGSTAPLLAQRSGPSGPQPHGHGNIANRRVIAVDAASRRTDASAASALQLCQSCQPHRPRPQPTSDCSPRKPTPISDAVTSHQLQQFQRCYSGKIVILTPELAKGKNPRISLKPDTLRHP